MAQRPVCGNHVEWYWEGRPGTLVWVVGQWSHTELSGGSAEGLGTQVPIMGGPARKLAQAEVGWGLGAQWHGGPWSL